MSDTHEDAVRTRFRETAAGVAEHAARQVDRVREELREFLPLTGEERALDSGTGAGVLALALAPLVREVVGVDLVPELLAAARAAAPANVTFVEGDAAALAFDRFERARDPSHARTLPDIDLRHLFEANGLVVERTRFQTHRRELDYYLELAGCRGEEAERVRGLSPGGPESYVAATGWYLVRKPRLGG